MPRLLTISVMMMILAVACISSPTSSIGAGDYDLTLAVIDPGNEPPREQVPPRVFGGLTLSRYDGTYSFTFGISNPWPGVFRDAGTFDIDTNQITLTSTDEPGLTASGSIDTDAGIIRLTHLEADTRNGSVSLTLTFTKVTYPRVPSASHLPAFGSLR